MRFLYQYTNILPHRK